MRDDSFVLEAAAAALVRFELTRRGPAALLFPCSFLLPRSLLSQRLCS